MKKPKKFKKPKFPGKVGSPLKTAGQSMDKVSRLAWRKPKTTEEKLSEALSSVPRITNETVSEHREEVLGSARKYIYPLQHSKHRIVKISVALLAAVVVSFFAIVTLSLYKFQSTSGFIYDVTRIIPFPVAKAGDSWVSYESYLFELRRNMHYYQTQQQANFDTKDGKTQLDRLKNQAMQQVLQDAYVKQLAAKNSVSVSKQQVDNQLDLVRQQNRLGSNQRVFREVLNEFWGWSEDDFKRELKQQMLKQAVVSKLDTATHTKATNALKQLANGADFAALATQESEDPNTKTNGGQYPAPLTRTGRELPPVLTAALFKLKQGQVSGVVDTGYTLEIVKALEVTPASVRASHIQFNLKDVNDYVKPLEVKNPPHRYIKIAS